MSSEALYQIRPGVARVKRAQSLILVSPEHGRAVRVSQVADELVTLLVDGASFESLAERLCARHPSATDVEGKLRAFLQELEQAGLLGKEPMARCTVRRFALVQPDTAAHWLATRILRLPRSLAWAMLATPTLAALVAVAALPLAGRLPHPSALVTQFSGWGLALFLLVVLLHESAHALACRLSGVQVCDAGLIMHAGLIPGPYVDTSRMYQVAGRGPHFWVAAAGPLVNLLSLGAAAAWLWLDEGTAAPSAVTLFMLCAVFVYLDTNPLTASDGSRMLEAVLGDELARRSALSRQRARLSGMRTIAWYRVACSLHLQGSVALLYCWWTWTV